ncbi:MAG: aldo/keto reductase [Candidatus Competibacteraceae bacterium]|nr:aldo/keto reductase [Candidatus Competibacteraceae bacterium]MCB1803722.1 aldo/keto reductase [Candidatus Competibacteraceae bacterium]MCB1811802.1 aldo/keto reductase [Candidatus Competibacteraceae bacterium]
MERRTLGNSGVAVTTLGFGGAPLGNLFRPVSEQDAQEVLNAAWDAGCRLFDTAPYYGYGLSERRFGDALRQRPRDEFILSSKVGRLIRPGYHPRKEQEGFVETLPFWADFDYSYDAVMRSVEDSYQRLGMDRIDVLLMHDIGRVTHGDEAHPALMKTAMESGYKALAELRDSGVIKAIGMGVNEWEVCQEALQYADFDCFLLAGRYTLLEQTSLDSFLPECERRQVSIIVGGPFNSGVLARGLDEQATYNYGAVPAAVRDKVTQLQAVCQDFQVPMPAAALQFPLAHPAIASIIPGSRTQAELEANCQLLQTPIPAAFWQALRERQLLHPDAPVPAGE